ncbi:DUF4340 domain-containing protein [bacterium]|nr:DUF4340 domain-containing protein [bacterium]
MNAKTTLILLLIALLGLGGIFAYKEYKKLSARSERKLGDTIYKDYPVNDITKVTLKNNKSEVTIEKEGNFWVVKDGSNFRAKYSMLANLLAEIYAMKAGQVINVRKSGYQKMSVADPDEVTTNAGLRVETFLPDGKKASSFILGRTKMHSTDDEMTARAFSVESLFVGQYVRLTDEEKPMLVRNIFRVNADPKDWRDPFILELKKDEIFRITGQDYLLTAAGEGGELLFEDGTKPNSGALLRLTGTLSRLEAQEVAETGEDLSGIYLKVELMSGLNYTLYGKSADGGDSLLSVKASFTAPDRGTNEVTRAEKDADLKAADEANQYNEWYGRFAYKVDKATFQKLFINEEGLKEPEKSDKPEAEKPANPFDALEDVEEDDA